jgi:hypothetical protein
MPWRSHCGLLKCWFKRHSDEGCDVDAVFGGKP